MPAHVSLSKNETQHRDRRECDVGGTWNRNIQQPRRSIKLLEARRQDVFQFGAQNRIELLRHFAVDPINFAITLDYSH